MNATGKPRLWHRSHPESAAHHSTVPILVGRQGVFTTGGELQGYELLFRASGYKEARADLWDAEDQDLATEHVIAAAFHQGTDITSGLDASVNFTGNYLLTHRDIACDPARVIIEILESTSLRPGLVTRLEELRDQGFRIALDDFMRTPAQLALLPLATFVKIDLRDLHEQGPALVERARGNDRILVAERVETQAELDEIVALQFDQVQGHLFAQAEVLRVPTRKGANG